MCELGEHGSGQCVNLVSAGVASCGYALAQHVGCCPLMAVEHGSGVEFVSGTGSLRSSDEGEGLLRNFQTILLPLREVSEVSSCSATQLLTAVFLVNCIRGKDYS